MAATGLIQESKSVYGFVAKRGQREKKRGYKKVVERGVFYIADEGRSRGDKEEDIYGGEECCKERWVWRGEGEREIKKEIERGRVAERTGKFYGRVLVSLVEQCQLTTSSNC